MRLGAGIGKFTFDVDTHLSKYLAALKEAGAHRLVAEIQKQFDAFLASKKNPELRANEPLPDDGMGQAGIASVAMNRFTQSRVLGREEAGRDKTEVANAD